MILYDRTALVFQEVPNEVAFAFTLTCCPGTCDGCHSPHLREVTGTELTTEHLRALLSTEKVRLCTCILFLGGDNDPDTLAVLVRESAALGFKTAVYSGRYFVPMLECLQELTYLKTGPWIESKGPLGSPTTNQRMRKRVDGEFVDITHWFA